jgi:hypothetical protein
LIEDEGEITTTKQVILMVGSIQKLYDSFQKLEDTDETPLSVAFLDSGSDKSFDFTGGASIINSIKGFLLDVYDRYVLHKKAKSENFMDVARGSIEIFEEIDARVKNGTLPKSAAKVIEAGLIEGMESFLIAGAITSEIELSEVELPRQIMKQEMKLLPSPSETEKTAKPKAQVRKKSTTRKKSATPAEK